MTLDTGHMYIAIHDRGSMGMGTNTNRDLDEGSRRLTHLAEFDMSVGPVLDPVPDSLELEDQVVDIGMTAEDRVEVELTISAYQGVGLTILTILLSWSWIAIPRRPPPSASTW
jgi:hypothetical protein